MQVSSVEEKCPHVNMPQVITKQYFEKGFMKENGRPAQVHGRVSAFKD